MVPRTPRRSTQRIVALISREIIAKGGCSFHNVKPGCRKQAITRNIKGAHFAVGCDCWDHHLPKRSAVMNQEKYIGMDVHQATISLAVMDSSGKVIMESILETKAATILEFIAGLRGTLSLTFEEGTSAAWLHDLLKPHVSHLVVCDPRRNALLKDGSKSDRIDARKLAELLHGNKLQAVYHGEHGVRTLKELGRSYLTITKDLTRIMRRIKALYRSWAIPCSGATVYAVRHRTDGWPRFQNLGFVCGRNGYISNWICCSRCAR